MRSFSIVLILLTGFAFLGWNSDLASAEAKSPVTFDARLQRKIIDDAQLAPSSGPISRDGGTDPQVGGVDTGFGSSVTEGSSRVFAVATQQDGKFLVGGMFSSVNGAARNNFERFNADGTRDESFNQGGTGPNGAVYVILPQPDNRIMIAGTFGAYNGATALRIARLNADGSLDTTFAPQGTSINGSVQDMIIQPDGKILVSGSFANFNGVTRNGVARLNSDGTLDAAFNPNVMNGGGSGFVEELVLRPNGKIVIGGVFTAVGGQPRNSVCGLNADGTIDLTFNIGSGAQNAGGTGEVYAAELQPDGKVLFGGFFNTFNGVARQSIVRLNTDGSVDTGFNTNTAGAAIEFFAIQPDNKVVVVGFFGTGLPGIMRFNTDGTTDGTFTGGAVDDYGYVVSVQPDGKLLFGGFFLQYGTFERRGIARLNSNGTPDNFVASLASEALVYAIVRMTDGKYMIGGQFRKVNGIERRNIARLNADGTLDPTFDAGSGADGINAPYVYTIAIQPDNRILVGGFFTSFAETPRNHFVRLNVDGSIDNSFTYNDATSIVRDIEVRALGKIVLAGNGFFNAAQQVNSGIVKLNSDGSYDQTALGGGTNGPVTRIAPYTDGSLKAMLVGNFTTCDGVPRNRVCRVNDDGTIDATFNPGTGANVTAWDVVLASGGQMYVSGAFTSFNGQPNTNDIVLLGAAGGVDPAFGTGASGFNGAVFKLSLEPDGTVLAGGNFNSYNGLPANQLVHLQSNGGLNNTFLSQLNPNAINVVEMLLRLPDNKVMVGGRFLGIGGVPRNSIARLNADPAGNCTSLPIAYGQSINGNLNSGSCGGLNPTDTYTFAGTAGEQIAISLDSIGTNGIQGAVLNLRNAGGTNLVATNSGTLNARIPASGFFTLPSTDTYTISVSSTPPTNFGDYVVSLTLQPAITCSYAIAPSATNINPSGGTAYFDVLSGDGCPTVTAQTGPNSGHLQIVSNSGGRVTFSVAPHSLTNDRVGTIIAGGQTHTITQFGVTPPANDFFAQAQLLPGGSGTVMGRTTNATAELNEPAHGGSAASRSVWYRWTAPTAGLYSFTTSGSTFDTVMAVYTGTSVSTITRIAENDNTTDFDLTSKINFRAAAGVEYFIAVDGRNGDSGSIQLTYGPYRRLFRLYLQNFNGFASPITPTSVTAIRQDGTGPTIPGEFISLGVYEFDLPDDNSPYVVTIAGPDGITWVPTTYVIDNTSGRFDELMQGAPGGGQNQTSNPTNTIPRRFKGFIHGISTQPGLNALRVQITSMGTSSAIPPQDCPNPTLVGGGPGGAMRVLYDCVAQPNSTHQIVPNAPQTAFQVPVLSLPVINMDTGPSSANAMTATNTPTYNITGTVSSGGQGLGDVNIDISTAAMTMRVTTSGTGTFTAPNLLPGQVYTIRASRPGYIFQSQTVNLQPPGATVDITAQNCTYTLTGNGNFAGSGGQGDITVTAANQGCSWTAVRDAEWITLQSGSSVGNGSVQFSVLPNNGAARQGTISVGEQSFTVTQASACAFNLAGGILDFPASGGTSSTMVTATDPGCSWNLASSDYCMIPGLAGEGVGNGTLTYTVAANNGVARRAVINVGGVPLEIRQAAATGTHRTKFDFNGDGKADISVFRPSTGFWYVLTSPTDFTSAQFGISEDIPVAADYDNDGKTDIAVYRPSLGDWYWTNSSNGEFVSQHFGQAGDIPAPGDFDGDGRSDLAVYRPSLGFWFILNSITGDYTAAQFGIEEDRPVAADFDGDGKTDIAVFRPSTGVWYISNSSDGSFTAYQFGSAEDVSVPADYDGDGKADIAVYRPSNSFWYRQNSSNGEFSILQFGVTGDLPAPADYNGDKFADIAVYRPSTTFWYIWSCTNNAAITATPFGISTDVPIPLPFSP